MLKCCVNMKCCVPACLSETAKSPKIHGVTFHLFPKEPEIRQKWLKSLGMSVWEPTDCESICSKHFRSEDFCITKSGRRKIRNGAMPENEFPTAIKMVLNSSTDEINGTLGCSVDYEDLDAPAALRVCRICLAIDTHTKMFHLREPDLNLAFEQLMGISACTEDNLPQKVCWECAQRLLNSSRFKIKVTRSQAMMMDILLASPYIKLGDIVSIDRSLNHLQSSLISRCYDSNDYDLHVNDDESYVKTELQNGGDGELKEEGECIDGVDNGEDITVTPIMEVEIKDEQAAETEIFIEEFPDQFESEDDRTLREVAETRVKVKIKAKEKRCKKKKKMEKKLKKKKAIEEDADPSSTMDKYKSSDVKRRKTHDGLDETLFTISTLTYEEQVAEIEKRQESTNYRTAPFKCTVCYRGFLIRDRYDAHIVRHSEASGAYECFICKTRLKTSRALRKHLTAQHTEKFSCKGCPFVTRNRGVAREHEKWHSGTKYECPHCPSSFDKLTTYMGHIRIKHVSHFVCDLCGYTFVSKKGVDVHKKKKHRLTTDVVPEDGPYCAVCDVKFISEEAHERHLKLSSRHSSDSDPNRIRNDSQSMNAEKNGRVMRKIERRPVIHPREQRGPGAGPGGPVACEQCGIQLRDLRLYAQHFRRAHPDKNRTKYPAMKTPCMCEQCGRIFQSMALLKDHMWVHTGEKRFKCDRCDKSFTQKTNLVFHMRVHSSARPTYECPLCGKHFAFFNNRRRHMFIHTGLKPFKCDTCGKCFTTAGERRAHVEHVHLKKPWPKRARATRPQRWPQPGTED